MSKTKDELSVLKQECETLDKKLGELTDEELEIVLGGGSLSDWFKKIAEQYKKIHRTEDSPNMALSPEELNDKTRFI